MITTNMRQYNYYVYGEPNAYGQPTLTKQQDTIKMCINLTSQNAQQNPLYEGATYVGLTHNSSITSKYVIEFNNQKLKVLYVNPFGRYKQVFMAVMA